MFEPRTTTGDVVGKVFRALIAACTDARSVASPILFTGDRGRDELAIFEKMIRSYIFWADNGLELDRLFLCMFVPNKQLVDCFARIKTEIAEEGGGGGGGGLASILPDRITKEFR